MKGEQQEDHPNNNNNNSSSRHASMFATPLHRHPHHPNLQWPPNPATLAAPDDEELSRSTTAAAPPSTKKSKTADPGSDGATIEVVRRPRGRPPGSKNKPKPPVVITRDADQCAMRPHVLEIPTGVDLVESIVRFARRRNVGLCVLSGTGSIANVSLRQPSTTPGATVTFHGRFDILSISATYLPSSSSSPLSGFAISLAGPQGQIFGGSVTGALVAASTVFIVATTFASPSYHRLPVEEEEEEEQVQQQQSGGGHHHHRPNSSGGGGGGAHTSTSSEGEERGAPPQTAETCGMSLYTGHLQSDVIWVPTARQPPPPF